MTEPTDIAVSVVPLMVAQVGHAEAGSIVKTTGFPEAPPVADERDLLADLQRSSRVNPEMVCARIDDTVEEPLMLTLNVAAGAEMLMVATPA